MPKFNGQAVFRHANNKSDGTYNDQLTGTYLGSSEFSEQPNGVVLRAHHFSAESTGGGITDSHVVRDTAEHQWKGGQVGGKYRFKPNSTSGDIFQGY